MVLLLGAACGSGPSEEDLERWLAEARAADEAAATEHGRADDRSGWSLAIGGRVERPVELGWEELSRLHPVEVRTRAHAEDALRSQHPATWRGLRIDALVDHAGAAADAREVTLLAYDGFRATVQLEDARRVPIILAHEVDGRPLARDAGGPLYAVYPIDEHPELSERYDGRWWVFYVTHLFVDTPAISVRVGPTMVLDQAALEALPEASLVETVGYRVGWPSEPVRLVGRRLRDVLAAAGQMLEPGMHVRVISHAPISHGDSRPTRLRAEDVLAGDAILATHWGEAREPIPARLGGPVVLAFSAEVAAHLTEHDWLTFVESVEVER
jgi:DMSO/TMAO reductase YedYZ molybdopterin-dependent catalytic subunit